MVRSEVSESRAVHRWGRFEAGIDVSGVDGLDPLREVQVAGLFRAPSGRQHRAPGFWDGGATWRVRCSPDEVGDWSYSVQVTVQGRLLPEEEGMLRCVAYDGDNALYRHGPPRMAPNRRHLVHADGTPWFFLADTVWNGPLLSQPEGWDHYIRTRKSQGFTAAQYVSTQWRTAPDGGPDGPTYVGGDKVERINPGFFRRLDARLDALCDAGIVGVPVLLWAIGGGQNAETNPGYVLSEEDAALLARYQIARWHAHPVIWILNGDGRYTGEQAERWRRIGRAVFDDEGRRTNGGGEGTSVLRPSSFVPVMTHPGGQQWVGQEFRDEPWLDVIGYQSGHGDDEKAWRWIVQGPPATEWPNVPGKAVINLEPCYEDHIAYQSKQRVTAEYVRRACYWSLLVGPTAGVTYGGHGIWGWDDGSGPPVAHPNTGTPQPWQDALHLPGAQQMRHLADFFMSIPWWQLRPDQSLVREQPGDVDITRYVTAARSEDLVALYLPKGGSVQLNPDRLPAQPAIEWCNPRDGSRHQESTGDLSTLNAPDEQDWLVVLRPA
jgi:hypothetical protein